MCKDSSVNSSITVQLLTVWVLNVSFTISSELFALS